MGPKIGKKVRIYIRDKDKEIHVATVHKNLRYRYEDRFFYIGDSLTSILQSDGLDAFQKAMKGIKNG